MAPGILVRVVNRWPYQARLLAWGKADDGRWGLIVWEQRIRVAGDSERMLYAAWVSSAQLVKPHWVAARRLRQHQLSADRNEWPAPSMWEWEGFYVGAWPSGDPPPPMEGVKVVKPAAERDSDTYSP
jgi:hypothetical protein